MSPDSQKPTANDSGVTGAIGRSVSDSDAPVVYVEDSPDDVPHPRPKLPSGNEVSLHQLMVGDKARSIVQTAPQSTKPINGGRVVLGRIGKIKSPPGNVENLATEPSPPPSQPKNSGLPDQPMEVDLSELLPDDDHCEEAHDTIYSSHHVPEGGSQPPISQGVSSTIVLGTHADLAPPILPKEFHATTKVSWTEPPVHNFNEALSDFDAGQRKRSDPIPSEPPLPLRTSDSPFLEAGKVFSSKQNAEATPSLGRLPPDLKKVPESKKSIDMRNIVLHYLAMYKGLNVDLTVVSKAAESFLRGSITPRLTSMLSAVFFRELTKCMMSFLPSESPENDPESLTGANGNVGHAQLSAMELFAKEQFEKFAPYDRDTHEYFIFGTFDPQTFTCRFEKSAGLTENLLSNICKQTKELTDLIPPEAEGLYPDFEEHVFEYMAGKGGVQGPESGRK